MPHKDPEAYRAYQREWYRRNREEMSARARKRYAERPEANRQRYERNKAKVIARVRAWAVANPVKVRAHRLRRSYGLSLEASIAIMESQGGRCAGCLTPLAWPSPEAHVDHDHSTGKVRGILCRSCNHALPHSMTPDTLRRLALYLERSAPP